MSFSKGNLAAYATYTDAFSAAVTFHGVQVLCYENFASTVAFESPWSSKLVNPFVGATFYNHGGEKQYTAANFIQLSSQLRFYSVADWGKVKEERFGLAYNLNQNIKLIGYYNVETDKSFVEIVGSF